MEPKIIAPFDQDALKFLQHHITEVRRCFDWPGVAYHDANETPELKFNRWFWHNLPTLRSLHNSAEFIKLASETFGVQVKPSYCFLSMYGPDGICPRHTDRPQCQFTVDLQINSNGSWPIIIDDKPYVLKDGDAICYSGTGQPHYRKAMAEGGNCTKMDLAFFHFVPRDWQGKLE